MKSINTIIAGCFVLIIIFPFFSRAQPNMKMDLYTDKKAEIVPLIRQYFRPYTVDRTNSILHAFDMYLINGKMGEADLQKFNFCSLPVIEAYSYLKNDNEFCLYLKIDLDSTIFDRLRSILGMPGNILTELEWAERDFDFLDWKKENINIAMFKNRQRGDKRSLVVFFTNIKFDDLPRNESIE